MTRLHMPLAAMALFVCAACEPAPTASSVPETPAPHAIRIVGSSTLYPFAVAVAQELRDKTGYNTVVEATGSGGGQKMFCAGAGPNTPDITASSRPQKPSERDACRQNGAGAIAELKIGYDGIVLANGYGRPAMDITLAQLYRALARRVPVDDGTCDLVENPYKLWSDIDPALPGTRIEIYGPPPTSGTRDAFIEIAMQDGASQITCLGDMKREAPEQFAAAYSALREDGAWINSGENDSAIIQTLTNAPAALGVFGYSFLHENPDKIQGTAIAGVTPRFETIASGHYPMSRALYIYIKQEKISANPGLALLISELTSEAAWGPDGYLAEIGLVPLPETERETYRAAMESVIADG